MKTAQTAATNYGTNGGSIAAQTQWAAGFVAKIPAILDAAVAAIPRWQAAVSTALAAANMASGLNAAKANVGAISTKVNTVGKASFSAGVKAASTGAYLGFATQWMPAVNAEVTQLNVTNPRGDRTANRARQAAYDAWVDTQAGNFRQ